MNRLFYCIVSMNHESLPKTSIPPIGMQLVPTQEIARSVIRKLKNKVRTISLRPGMSRPTPPRRNSMNSATPTDFGTRSVNLYWLVAGVTSTWNFRSRPTHASAAKTKLPSSSTDISILLTSNQIMLWHWMVTLENLSCSICYVVQVNCNVDEWITQESCELC